MYLIKWFMPQICKELIQVNSKNKQIIQLKIGRGTEHFFFKDNIQVANRYMQRCSVSLIARKMQSKATMSYCLTC